MASAPAPASCFCPVPSIPSEGSARDLVNGRRGALVRVAVHTVARAGVISAGLVAFGDAPNSTTFKRALYGSLAIELMVLVVVGKRRRYA